MLLEGISFNTVVVSIAFFFIFSSYNTIQNFATSLLPGNLGNVSLSVLYASVAVSVFFAAPVIRRWGAKWTMVAGSLTYCAYIASVRDAIEMLSLRRGCPASQHKTRFRQLLRAPCRHCSSSKLFPVLC
jgi:hypothetical protein